MAVEWTEHRFSGGVLALDLANTVVLRCDSERSFDRFENPDEIARFAEAASIFRADELAGRQISAVDPEAVHTSVVSLREAVDRLFRHSVLNQSMRADDVATMLSACATGMAGSKETVTAEQPFGNPKTPMRIETALSVSALSLLAQPIRERIRICANCAWLFLDRSRNGSRVWCDMAVCGNRQKAKRHYRLRKAQPGRVSS
ncbi:CGNR zinc finger domain-containing protein [Mesorhizobium sp. SB112]|uniref:CGNR zinc finger domain-containing protein n=1 Tax=Mesorhizobium sp. SB112 TaxID=3151853 RepID=UPI003264B928